MSLSNYITEQLHTTSIGELLRVKPTSKHELQVIIAQELERQGPDADLNFIDTSEITDMSRLFSLLLETDKKPRYVQIDEWDTSNVTNMMEMFYGCDKFNCDLSNWDTSNVTDMSKMFYGCRCFTFNLSKWNVSKVKRHENMFELCWIKSKPQMQPKFK